MANSRRLRRGVVKQLSNLSIDEVSLVDRGANQHALISIAKRAPEAEDYFDAEDVEKFDMYNRDSAKHYRKTNPLGHRLAVATLPKYHGERKQNYRDTYEGHPKTAGAYGLPTGHGAGPTAAVGAAHAAGLVGGAIAGSHLGGRVGGEAGSAVGAIGGAVTGELAAGAKAGQVVHNHYYGKRATEEPLNVDELFGKASSFGRGGENSKADTFSGDDPSGVLDDENGEKGNVGPGKKIDGVEVTEGEDTPPQKSKKKGSGDINPSKLSGLGKSADFWKNVVSKALGEEFGTDDESYDDDVEKHFPGGGGFGQPQNPMQSPFPGAQGPGMAPAMQTPGVQPMGMGQPTPPPGGGMPSQLPPEVVQYIQQLEQALDQATGGGDQSDGSDDSGSQQSSGSSSDDDKKNPFGKSLESSDMDETTFLTELAKSLDDDSEREAVEKALETVRKAEHRAAQAEQIAKAERDLRLEREFIAKAAEFNLPVKADELGPVLKRAAESLGSEDFKTIVKCLRSASAAEEYGNGLFAEVGKRGGGDNADVLSSVDAAAAELVTKSEGLTPEAATLQVLADNPRAYDEYMRDHPSRRMFR